MLRRRVLKAAIAAASMNLFPGWLHGVGGNTLNLVVWGDSMAAGDGVSSAAQHWINVASGTLNRTFSNQGVGGITYPQTAALQTADTTHQDWTNLYWAGHNSTDVSVDMPALASMIAHQTGNRRFLVLLPTINAANPPNDSTVLADRSAIISTYPSNYIDIPSMLATHGDGGTQDNSDIANGYTPTSLRAVGDTIHLNATGQSFVAGSVTAALQAKGW